MTDIDQLAINTIRGLAIDAVQRANSGHPGTPLGAAPTAYTLWQRFLRYDPADPDWPNRDRFVLSSGHACMLLYALIHLARIKAASPTYATLGGPAVSLDDIKGFRQGLARCPGHPEHGWTSGVEATTGPLGQGVANSVGMAIAAHWLGATYNRPGYALFDFRTFALCGDGDMMEGIASEAASLAGHLELGNLCWIYDSNRMSIEGHTDLASSDDAAARFRSYGWAVLDVADANDVAALEHAYRSVAADRPTLIVVHSIIGYGAPNRADTKEAHGEPLGVAEVRLTKQFLGLDPDRDFVVPPEVPAHFDANFGARGARLHRDWRALFDRYRAEYPDLADQLDRMFRGDLPEGWQAALPSYPPDTKGLATRDASGKILNALAGKIPWLLGGAADLAPSTKTNLTFEGAGSFEPGTPGGRNFHFGVREHAMCAVVNGMVLSGLRAFASGFLVFTDYARGAIRLSALMELPALHIWTHDSIGVGEDGPTHQPIEQMLSLRAIPGMMVIRPCDANEMVEAYRVALSQTARPVALICSRQPLPTLDRTKFAPAAGLARGGYVLADSEGRPDVILIATGSEIGLIIAARSLLAAEGIAARLVSLPSWELFEDQDQAYRDSVLPPDILARVTVEEASAIGWDRYAGSAGIILGMRTFGLSAPIKIVAEHFGFSPAAVVAAARKSMAQA